MTLREYSSKRRTWGSRRIPKSVQQSIPIERIYEDGIWQSGDVYSKMWELTDVNYATLSDNGKTAVRQQLGIVYSCLPSDCWCKICLVSQRMDEASFRESVLLHRQEDEFNDMRIEMNRVVKGKVENLGNVTQHKYLILSTNKQNVEMAREKFLNVAGNLIGAVSALGSSFIEVPNEVRLKVLHDFFRIGEENEFYYDRESCKKLGTDFRDYIAPEAFRFSSSHIKIGDRVARAISLSEYPHQLSDDLIPRLLRTAHYTVVSIDLVPIEVEDAYRELDASRMKVDADKVKFNRKSVDNLDFTSSLSPKVREQERNLDAIQEDMAENDQQMFCTLVTVAYFEDTLEELERTTEKLKGQIKNMNCRFALMKYQQENAFNTAMPYGLRRIENMRMMLTGSVVALVPFHTQDVMDPHGVYYGTNPISGNLIIGSRRALINGNGMILATSGGGKSFIVKQEIAYILLSDPNVRIIVVDPENEFRPLTEGFHGQSVDLAVNSTTYFNPLDFEYDPDVNNSPTAEKIEFILALCEQIIGKEKMEANDRSIINRSLKNIYAPLMKSGYTLPPPTLTDLWHDLDQRRERRAKELAEILWIFANGDLNMFAHHTNVDMDNRLICFNLQALGNQMKPVAMLAMLEFINTCVMHNKAHSSKIATWVYYDEAHIMIRDCGQFLHESWKRYRKYNAYATGITQNLTDCLKNDVGRTMLSNSEFLVLLRQSEQELQEVIKIYNLSPPQANWLRLAKSGQGLIKLGNTMIPFDDTFPKRTQLFKLFNTTPASKKEVTGE